MNDAGNEERAAPQAPGNPDRFYPRTEGQAKAALIVIALVIVAAIAALVFGGTNIRAMFGE